MALTSTELLSIVRILHTTPSLLDAQIASLGADMDADRETAIREELDRWTTAGGKFVKLHPTESNFGVETNAGDAKSDIIANLAALLEWPFAVGTSSIGTLQIG
jgi:hypothetical protein